MTAGLVMLLATAGCSSANPPSLPTIPPLADGSTAALASPLAGPGQAQEQPDESQPQAQAEVRQAQVSAAAPVPAPPLSVMGRPTEIYERIARGALACWFGPSGALQSNYVYHADAEPPSKGGRAVIVIHERDRSSANPKGLRAYRIRIDPDNSGTIIATENLKLSELLAAAMDADARRWGAGATGCGATDAVGWSERG